MEKKNDFHTKKIIISCVNYQTLRPALNETSEIVGGELCS